MDKLDLVTKDEFEILKKIIEKQQKEITNLKKKNQKGKEILTKQTHCICSSIRNISTVRFNYVLGNESPKPTPDLFNPLLLSTL